VQLALVLVQRLVLVLVLPRAQLVLERQAQALVRRLLEPLAQSRRRSSQRLQLVSSWYRASTSL
jgi:hypothetical protein